ncbi:MAG: Mut7-C RNAse domain-containing protein [Candidatus Bathyarchaeia archaeon]
MRDRRFLLDGMLGKLARWLRLLGEEAIYERDMADDDLVAKALKEKLILLTSDEELFRMASSRGVEACLVERRPIHEELRLLAGRYGICLELDPSLSRCPRCGAPLRGASREEVEGSVPPGSFMRYREYWICSNKSCKKVYWRGSHWRNIHKTLRKCGGVRGAGIDEAEAQPRGRGAPSQARQEGHSGMAEEPRKDKPP